MDNNIYDGNERRCDLRVFDNGTLEPIDIGTYSSKTDHEYHRKKWYLARYGPLYMAA